MDRPRTKDQALRGLGIDSRSVRRSVTPYVEFHELPSGQRLLNRRATYADVLCGVAGSVALTTSGLSLALHGPFVIDRWALDPDGRSLLDLTTSSSLALVRVDWQFRAVVFEAVPALAELSASTCALVSGDDPSLQLSA